MSAAGAWVARPTMRVVNPRVARAGGPPLSAWRTSRGGDWRSFRFSRTPRAVVAPSRGVQDAGAQELEAGAAVHGPLDGLDAVDLALGGAGGPGQVEGGLDGVHVAAQA